MRYFEFRKKIKDFPLFETRDLKLILGEEFNRSFLNLLKNWEESGHIIKIRKGLYLLEDANDLIDPIFLAPKIYQPSYVSLETALSYYGIIPEAVFTTTSVTTRKTKEFHHSLFGKFSYQKIKRNAFGGFETFNKNGFSYKLALPEKAIVDFLYLNRKILDGTQEQFESCRFNEEYKYGKNKLLKFSKLFVNKKTLFLTREFIKFYASK